MTQAVPTLLSVITPVEENFDTKRSSLFSFAVCEEKKLLGWQLISGQIGDNFDERHLWKKTLLAEIFHQLLFRF